MATEGSNQERPAGQWRVLECPLDQADPSQGGRLPLSVKHSFLSAWLSLTHSTTLQQLQVSPHQDRENSFVRWLGVKE